MFESDQAIIGLMARHIWLNGEHPLFFYGQFYMGPVESYAAVPFFSLFGSSIFSLRLAMVPLVLLFLAIIYVLGRVAYGPVAGVLALAWLVLGPTLAVDRELTTFGGKQEMLVLAGVVMLCAWARLKLSERRPHGRRAWLTCLATYGLLGAASGLGVWSDWLIAPVVLSTLLVLALVRPRELFFWPAAFLIAGFVVAAFPFLQFNFAQQFASLHQALYFSNPSGASSLSRLSQLPIAIAQLAAMDLPAAVGSPHVCVQSMTDLQSYPWITHLGPLGSTCSLANIALSTVIVVLFVVATWPLAQAIRASLRGIRAHTRYQSPRTLFSAAAVTRLWRKLDIPLSDEVALRTAQLWLRGIMIASTLAWVIAFVINPADLANPLTKSRYLVPVYLGTPVLFGTLYEMLRPGLAHLLRHAAPAVARVSSPDAEVRLSAKPYFTWGAIARAYLAGAALIVLLALSLVDGFAMAADAGNTSLYALPEPPASAKILTFFDAHEVHTFYTDSYYTCYRYAFESNERQVCAVLGADGRAAPQIWLNRYAPYVLAVARDPHPAYLLTASTGEALAFASSDLPRMGYKRAVVSGRAIYYFSDAGR